MVPLLHLGGSRQSHTVPGSSEPRMPEVDDFEGQPGCHLVPCISSMKQRNVTDMLIRIPLGKNMMKLVMILDMWYQWIPVYQLVAQSRVVERSMLASAR